MQSNKLRFQPASPNGAELLRVRHLGTPSKQRQAQALPSRLKRFKILSVMVTMQHAPSEDLPTTQRAARGCASGVRHIPHLADVLPRMLQLLPDACPWILPQTLTCSEHSQELQQLNPQALKPLKPQKPQKPETLNPKPQALSPKPEVAPSEASEDEEPTPAATWEAGLAPNSFQKPGE